MTLKEFTQALYKELAYYGFTTKEFPSSAQLELIYRYTKGDIGEAYGVCCDINAGYSVEEALDLDNNYIVSQYR